MYRIVWTGLFLLHLGSTYGQDTLGFFRINSEYDEQSPVMSRDKKTLFFTRAYHPQNVNGKKDPGDIWVSYWTHDGWGYPIHGGKKINNNNYNAVLGTSTDDKSLYLVGHYSQYTKTPPVRGISVTKRIGNQFSRPKNIRIPHFISRAQQVNGSILPAANVFVFSADSYGTYGSDDIYISIKDQTGWNKPIHLRSAINTMYEERSPYLSEDTRVLYFSTNSKNQIRSFDVYQTERLDDSWTNWSEPVEVSAEHINTIGKDLYYRLSSTSQALYTSTYSSDGYGDIRWVAVSKHKIQHDEPVIHDSTEQVWQGQVVNINTAEPIMAHVQIHGKQVHETYSNPIDGKFTLPWHELDSIAFVRIEASDFVSYSDKVYPPDSAVIFELQPIVQGTVVDLKNVLFKTGTSHFIPESYEELNMVVDFLKTHNKITIRVEGHTDIRGNSGLNMQLSKQRANTVRDYFIQQGISPYRIESVGYGDTRPLVVSQDPEQGKINRRVEFVIISTE